MAILLAIPLFVVFFGAFLFILYCSHKFFNDSDTDSNNNENVYDGSESQRNAHDSIGIHTSNNCDEYVRCCSILDLESNCSLYEIKESYKTLVKVWHPDRYHHDEKLRIKAQDKLKKINEAYSYLLRNVA